MPVNIASNYQDFAAHTGVKFLQGLQSAVNTLIDAGGATEGAFYLTKDSHRLYVGRNDGTKVIPVAVNEGVVTVANTGALPNTANPGEFYYCESENILCVCSGVTGSGAQRECTWVQLNTNSHLTTNSLTQTIAAVSGNDNAAKITTTVTDSSGNSSSANFQLLGADDNITITYNNTSKTVTLAVKDTTYTLGTAASAANTDEAKITLTPAGGTAQTITITPLTDSGDIKIASDANGNITLGQRKTTGTATSYGASNVGWKVGVQVDGTTQTTQGTIDPVITYGASGDTSNVHFNSGTATLDVYTIAQADNAISAAISSLENTINAMKFCGTVESANELDAVSAWHVGDVYKIADSFTYTGHGLTSQYLKVGDVIIATGTEGSNGTITSGLTFNYIPSGDENSYTGMFSATQGGTAFAGMKIMEGGTTEIAGFHLVQGTQQLITITPSVSGNHNTITLEHSTVSTNLTTTGTAESQSHSMTRDTSANVATALEIWVPDGTASSSFSTDGYGHLTAVKLKKVTLQDTHNYVKSFAVTVADTAAASLPSGATDGVTQTFTVQHADGTASTTGTFAYSTKTLTMTAGTNAMSVDIEWGSF